MKFIIYTFRTFFFIRYGLSYLWRRIRYGRPDWTYTGPNGDDCFDVFISYKSGQSEDIRILAEALLACGVRVWFDEYQINPFNRAQFQNEVDIAIKRSILFVYFDTEKYKKSEYCQHELNQARQYAENWTKKALRIIDVQDSSGPNGLFVEDGISTLRESTAYTYSAVLRKSLDAIGKKLGREFSIEFRGSMTFVPHAKSVRLLVGMYDVRVFALGWTIA